MSPRPRGGLLLALLALGGAAAPGPELSPEQRAALGPFEAGAVTKRDVEIVVAACGDDVAAWLRPAFRPLATVTDPCRKAPVAPANVGRESAVYLRHITENYDRLAAWTVFTQGHAPSEYGGHLVAGAAFDDYVLARASGRRFYHVVSSAVATTDPQNLRHRLRGAFDPNGGAAARDAWGATECPAGPELLGGGDGFTAPFDMKLKAGAGEGAFERLAAALGRAAAPRSLPEYAREVAAAPLADVVFFAQGARFAVAREAIRARPRAYYAALLAEVAAENDPYQSYYNEYLWPAVFGHSSDCAPRGPKAFFAGASAGAADRRRLASGTSATIRDNDKDGVADAAVDGTCCAFTYGNAFAGCSGATDLAGAAGCCPSDFLLRHSIQATGEDTTSYDCVSFRSQTDCAAYTWSVTGGGSMTPQWMAANCPHTTSSNVVDAAAPRAVGLLALLALLFSA